MPEEKNEFELLTKNGHRLDVVASALQKSLRRGLEERALYFMHELIESGYTKYFWRRISTATIEDFGLSDPQAIILINSLAQTNERMNHKKGVVDTYCAGMAVLYLCRTTKSREVDYALDWIEMERKEGLVLHPNDIELDCHTHHGKVKLKKLSEETGKPYDQLVDEKFYYEGILANKPFITR